MIEPQPNMFMSLLLGIATAISIAIIFVVHALVAMIPAVLDMIAAIQEGNWGDVLELLQRSQGLIALLVAMTGLFVFSLTLAGKVGGNGAIITSLKIGIAEVRADIKQMDDKQDKFRDEFHENVAEIKVKHAVIENRVNAHDARLDKIERRKV